MSEKTDQELLREHFETGSEDAFADLVHRHVDLVYSTALRILNNFSLAEEVTQRTFLALSQNARKLQDRSILTGWLYETARNSAVTTIRSENRRRLREQEAALMQTQDSSEDQPPWAQMAPHLDDALAKLGTHDRDLILLRFFERKPAREIAAQFGLTEEAAQKRAARALERLRTIFAEGGLPSSAAGLAAALSIQAVHSAPAGLTASVIAAAETGKVVTSTLGIIMASAKAKLGIAAILMAAVSTPLVLQHQTNARLQEELSDLRQKNAQLEQWRQENPRPAAQNTEDTAQRRKERDELLRLRGEVTALRAQASESPKARREAARPASAGESQPETQLVPAESWANVGFASPVDAFQTLHWARARRDTNVIANALAWSDERTRDQIESLFAAAPESVRQRYGTADAYILSLFDHPTPDDSRRVTGYKVLNENIGDTQATISVEEQIADGRTSVREMNFVRIDNGWRQALDFDRAGTSKLGKALQAEANPANP